ncbi:MAG: transcriptional regulator, partial [Candidatus Hodarchaeales archaeon]|jgi:DNA-binding MarR family transcriptional regulator
MASPELNKLIHEPSRLKIVVQLYAIERADFLYLKRQLGLTWGNLSAHLSKLEKAGYLEIKKSIVNKKTHTSVRLTSRGRISFEEYRKSLKVVLGDD